ncbi:hypothetical protein CASFOL_028245 [Castilleja foliolosa]|uniref:Uncharacterized protein n=1 Tax=Castilleja foliolosa TaxID=1961234 RepID=A0ABD3CD73_9LAMI
MEGIGPDRGDGAWWVGGSSVVFWRWGMVEIVPGLDDDVIIIMDSWIKWDGCPRFIPISYREVMEMLNKLDFQPLNVLGENYVSWTMDVRTHLISRQLDNAIIHPNSLTEADRAKAMILLRRHLDEVLKLDYSSVGNPQILWEALASCFDHQKAILLPEARNRWTHQRFMDFETVNAYNSDVCRIKSILEFCGEKLSEAEILEKTYSTFPASHVILSQQYRAKNYTKFSELITVLLLAEKNFDLLMKNNQARPIGTKPLPEVNANQRNFQGRGNGRGFYQQNRGRGSKGNFTPYNNKASNYFKKFVPRGGNRGNRGRGGRGNQQGRDNNQQYEIQTQNQTTFYRCGGNGHWSRTCRANITKNNPPTGETSYAEANDFDVDTFLNLEPLVDLPDLGTSGPMTQSEI